MITIYHLLKLLNKSERKKLLELYQCLHGHASKTTSLLKALISKNLVEDSEACFLLYGKACSPAYAQIKKRLNEELPELILLLKKEELDSTMKQRIKNQELICYAQILMSKSEKEESVKILEKVGSKAQKYALHDVIILTNDFIRNYGLHSPRDTHPLSLIKKAAIATIATAEAEADFYHLHLEPEWQSAEEKSWLAKVELWKILKDCQGTLKCKDLSSVEELLDKASKMMEHNRHLSTPIINFELNYLYLKLSILQNQFENASKYAEKLVEGPAYLLAQRPSIIKKSFGLLIKCRKYSVLQICFESFLKGGELTQAVHAQVWYFKAAISFQLKNWSKAMKFIHRAHRCVKCQNYSLKSDIYLLEILTLFEMKEYDWLEYKLEAFRKLVGYKKFSNQKEMILISKILKWVLKCSTASPPILFQRPPIVTKFHNNDDGINWLIFHHWLSQHLIK